MKSIFENAALIDWLSAQDPLASYGYMDCRACLLAQYLRFRGFEEVVVDTDSAYLEAHRFNPRQFPPHWNDIAVRKPWTFGAALGRAREML